MQRPPGASVARGETALRWLLVAALAVVLGYVGVRAAQLRIEYYDGYDYLRSARALAGDSSVEFQRLRPPLVSILQLPAMAVVEASPPASPVRLIAPHVTSAFASALSAGAVFWLLSRCFGVTLSLLGTLLFATSRFYVHYAPFSMADIPAAGWAAASTALYLRARERRSFAAFAACGLALGAAVLTKFPLGVLGPAWALAELGRTLVTRRIDARAWLGIAMLGGVAAVTLLGVEVVLLRVVYGADWFATLARMPAEFVTLSAMSVGPGERFSDYGAMCVAMLSLPTLLAGGAGVLLCVARRDGRDVPQLASLVGIAGITVFAMRHNEARYLLPAVPFLLHFALRSVEAARDALLPRLNLLGRAGRALVWLLAAAVLAPALAVGLDQARRDTDPVYAADSQRLASEWMLAAQRDGGRLIWNGNMHPLRTRWAGFVPHDEYFGVFHHAPFVVAYFLDRPLSVLADTRPRTPHEIAPLLRDGDVVLRAADMYYDAVALPPADLPPMEVWAVSRRRFRALGPDEFADERDPESRIRLHRSPNRTTLSASSLTGEWRVRLIGASGAGSWHAGTVRLEPGIAVSISHGADEPLQAIEVIQLARTRFD